jgi:hypothetical protein
MGKWPLVIVCFATSTVAFGGTKKEASGNYDFNFGLSAGNQRTGDAVSQSVSLFANTEAVYQSGIKWRASHFGVFDAKFVSITGQERFPRETDEQRMRLNFQGHISAGLQAYNFIPLNLTVEDIDMTVADGQTRSRGLWGSTLYVLATGNNDRTILLGSTFGTRRDRHGSRPGVQPKLRILTEDYSLELAVLRSSGGGLTERQIRGSLARNHLWANGSQIGLQFRYNEMDFRDGAATVEASEVLLYMGHNL